MFMEAKYHFKEIIITQLKNPSRDNTKSFARFTFEVETETEILEMKVCLECCDLDGWETNEYENRLHIPYSEQLIKTIRRYEKNRKTNI